MELFVNKNSPHNCVQVTPDKREVRSTVTVEGDTFKHVSKAKKECIRYMTIEKKPEVEGVMRFRRMVDGKVVEQMETSSIDFDAAETLAKGLDIK